MSQITPRTVSVPTWVRWAIALPAAFSPLVITCVFVFATTGATETDGAEWVSYLLKNWDDLVQSLIVSSVMVAVFTALLACKPLALAAAFQPPVIHVGFIISDPSLGWLAGLPMLLITVLPLAILLAVFIPNLRELYDRGSGKPS